MAIAVSNYVKFRRGTPEAFKKLVHKDSDTLYFIYEEDELTGELYLGSKLIAGAGEINGATTLAGLTDTIIENIQAEDFLVYDITQEKWINKPIKDVLENFVGANATSNGISGLVPAPEAGKTGLFLRSDGQWAEVISSGSSQIFQTIVASNESHEDAINRIIKNSVSPVQSGDIVILSEPIDSTDKYTKISYIYDGTKWVGMEGNYNAENVYLTDNITITADIGVHTLDGAGSKELETAGKNIKEVFNMLVSERKLPEKTNPSITVNWVSEKEYEVGSEVSLSYNIDLNPGSYSFGPDTEVVATTYEVAFGNQVKNTREGVFEGVVITDNFNDQITATVSHSEGVAPKDNYGNVITDVSELNQCKISKGNLTAHSDSIVGYRNIFYGFYSNPVELNSDSIRLLNKEKEAVEEISLITENATKQLVVAVPTNKKITKIADTNAFGINILNKFSVNVMDVNGANNSYGKDYDVYQYIPSVALKANTYIITIEDKEVEENV